MPTDPNTIPVAPLPPTAADATRWRAVEKRERMMGGGSLWMPDLEREMANQFGALRTAAQGVTQPPTCLLRNISTQLACLYDKAPEISNPDGAEAMAALLDDAGLWQLMIGIQQKTIAYNEMLIAISVTPDGRPLFRPVSPSKIVATADPNEPDEPRSISEIRLRRHPETGAVAWYWDVWRPDECYFAIRSCGEKSEDVTSLFVEGATGPLEGEDYPWIDDAGDCVLPFSLIHATRSGALWNTYVNDEIVSASLMCGAGISYVFHTFRTCAFPQRYAVNCSLPGLGIEGSDGSRRSSITTDPATILCLTQDDDTHSPLLGQFKAAADPGALLSTLTDFEVRVAESAGISPSDISRMSGSAARSGYAIAISQAGKREAAARYAPSQRRALVTLISRTAAMVNSITAGFRDRLPVEGWKIDFSSIPKSTEELDAERRHVLELLDANLIDRAEALQILNPGLSREAAQLRLALVQGFNGATAPGATPAVNGLPMLPDLGGERAADTALNGAQVLAAQTIVERVSAGQLPRATGVEMLASFFNLPARTAESIMGTVGRSFTPTPTPDA